jgi:mono/diheme cytochrome c family protein
MKKLFGFLAICTAASSLILTGCGLDQSPPYSSDVKYGLRTDPLVFGPTKDLGDERFDPDRPGVFPIMKMEQVFDPEFPFNAQFRKTLQPILDDLIEKEKKDPKTLSPTERIALENKLLRDPKNRPKFDPTLDKTIRDPMNISAADRKELEKALDDQFGTPAKPTLNAKAADIDDETVKLLKLDDETLKEGSRNYRIHCMHCHGVPGDGRGPTSRWVNPHPRDFRRGLFKFQSVDQTGGTLSPPARGDLLRTLRQGLEGTAMPSFNLLHDKDLEALVSYVMYLSIRGNAEFRVMSFFFKLSGGKDGAAALVWEAINADDEPMDKAEAVKFFLKKKIIYGEGGWKEANNPANAIKPVPYPYKEGDMKQLAESVQRGQQLFIGSKDHPRGKDANCKQCHDDYGRQARFKFDDWGTFTRPNNFPQGIFRGGKRPVDLYYRVHSGINGSGMIIFGKVLPGEDIWDLVNFVSSLSYPAMYDKIGIKIN